MLLLQASGIFAAELQLRPRVVPRVPEVRQALRLQDVEATGVCKARSVAEEGLVVEYHGIRVVLPHHRDRFTENAARSCGSAVSATSSISRGQVQQEFGGTAGFRLGQSRP